MDQYLSLALDVIRNGELKEIDRNDALTISRFGPQMEFDLRDGFPIVTTKKIPVKAVVGELLWFLRGETNVRSLQEQNIKIWDKWADEDGELGPVYGKQWRSWEDADGNFHDQIYTAIELLRDDPTNRANIVSAWNVGDLEDMALKPCHAFFQFNSDGEYLDTKLYQRSADVFLGVPFNISSYALLQTMIADQTRLIPRKFVHTFGDAHIYLGEGSVGDWYSNNLDELRVKLDEQSAEEVIKWIESERPESDGSDHLVQMLTQSTRKPKNLPTLNLENRTNIDDYRDEDITLTDYDHHPHIPGKVS